MLCMPCASSESLASDSCNLFYTRSALASSPTTKFDLVGARRLSSKKHCNQSPSAPLCLRQESHSNVNGNVNGNGSSPSSVAGMWHRGAKAQAWSISPGLIAEPFIRSSEQTLDVLKAPQKTIDVIKQSQKTLKVCFTESKPSEQTLESQFTGIKPSGKTPEAQFTGIKPSEQTHEAQFTGINTDEHPSQAPFNGAKPSEVAPPITDTNLCQQTQNNYPTLFGNESSKHASESQFTRIEPSQHSPDYLSTGMYSSAQNVKHHFTGVVPSEQTLEAEYTGINSNQDIWIKPSSRTQRAQLNGIKFSDSSMDAGLQGLCEGNKSVINGSRFHSKRNGAQHEDMEDEVHENGFVGNFRQSYRQMPDAAQHSYIEDDKHLVKGSHRDGATPLHMEGQVLGREYVINGSHSQRPRHVTQHPEVGEQVLNFTMEETRQPKEPVVVSSVSQSANKVAAIRLPAYRTPFLRSSVKVSESILYLESLGADCSRLIREDPSVVTCDAKRLRELVCALEHYGLKWNDLGRIFNLCPKILHLSPERDLKLVTSFLFDEVGLSPKDFSKVTRRCPRLLACEVNEQLWPTLRFLRTLGFSKMGQVVSNNATLLSFSVEKKLVPKLRYLESLGFTYREAVSMVVRFPAIFNYSSKENLQPKYNYLVHEMGGKSKDLLAFPQYFGYSLEKRIRPRHRCIVKQDVSLSLQAMLKLSEAEFNAKFQCVSRLDHLSKDVFAPLETSDAKFHECALESLKFVSFNNPGTPVLVGAQRC